jgi:hypothetical protein
MFSSDPNLGGGAISARKRLTDELIQETISPQIEVQGSPLEDESIMDVVPNPSNPYLELYSQFQRMPAKSKSKKGGKRKATSGYRRYGGRKLSPAAAHLARLADIKIKRAKFDQELSALTDHEAGQDPPLSQFPGQTRAARDLLDTKMSLATGRVHGRGRYTFGSFMRNLESTGRRFLRSGGGLDTILGAANRAKSAVEGMGRYGGMGAYHDNQLIEGGALSSDVIGNTDETDTIVISDEEFIQNVYAPTIASGSSGFAAISLGFNPGLQNLTRKLSQYSKHYQEYELGQLVFRLEPMVEESNVNNGITGSFSMAWQYDPNEEEPDNEDDMNALYGVCIGHKLSDGLRLGVECDPVKVNKTSYRVRAHPVPYGRDVDEYDHGKLVIASNNIPSTFSNLAIAKLHLYYTIKLRKFKPDKTILRDIYSVSKNATAALFTATPTTHFTENTVVYAQQNNLGCRINYNPQVGGFYVIFPPTFSGAVSITLRFEGTGLTTTGNNVFKQGNVQFISDFIAGFGAGDPPSATNVISSATTCQVETRARIQSATGSLDNYVFVGLTPSAGTVTQWVLDISEYSPQFFQSRTNPVPIVLNLTNNRVEELS